MLFRRPARRHRMGYAVHQLAARRQGCFRQSSMAPPVSNTWGFINNPKFDELVTKARQTFDPAARDAALAELHAASVDDAAFLYVAHDVAPRAMSPKIKGFVQPKSWFVDFSSISMTP